MKGHKYEYENVGIISSAFQKIFKDNLDVIRDLNAKSWASGKYNAATYDLNFTADFTDEEFNKMTGLAEVDSS